MKNTMMSLRESVFDEVHDAQKIFRVLLDAMTYPGRVFSLRQLPFENAPAGFNPHVLGLFMSLCDNNTTFCVDNEMPVSFAEYITCNTRSRPAPAKDAGIILCRGEKLAAGFCEAGNGSADFPEDGATAIIQVKGLSGSFEASNGDRHLALMLQGPGIKGRQLLSVTGLDPEYISVLMEKNKYFPMGIDCFFMASDNTITGVPRSSRLEVV